MYSRYEDAITTATPSSAHPANGRRERHWLLLSCFGVNPLGSSTPTDYPDSQSIATDEQRRVEVCGNIPTAITGEPGESHGATPLARGDAMPSHQAPSVHSNQRCLAVRGCVGFLWVLCGLLRATCHLAPSVPQHFCHHPTTLTYPAGKPHKVKSCLGGSTGY